MLLSSSGQRPRMLLNLLQCTGQRHSKDLSKTSAVLSLRIPKMRYDEEVLSHGNCSV